MFHPKLSKTLKGKKNGCRGWNFSDEDDRPLILIHVASEGEYEGAKPLIDQLIGTNRMNVAVSFSSPSVKKSVSATDGLFAYGFLPHDFLIEQLRLLDRLEPELVLIFKHDFWPNLLRAASLLSITIGLVNANFHSRSQRGLPIIKLFHKAFMKNLNFIWTVGEADRDRIKPLVSSGTKLRVGGDTRYDRVIIRAERGTYSFKQLSDAFTGKHIIVAGSTWEQDEKIIFQAFAAIRATNPSLRLIAAPHEPVPSALHRIGGLAEKYSMRSLLWSNFDGKKIDEDVLIIDQTRILAGIYSVGWAAYVGGGFGVGVHSVIEPAACSLPVIFGPNHHVSHEAGLLISIKGGFEVHNSAQVKEIWSAWLDNYDAYESASKAALQVVTSNAGAVNRLMEKVESCLKLNTN